MVYRIRHFPPSLRPRGARVIREGEGAMHVGGRRRASPAVSPPVASMIIDN
jgi:hypothetical protein